MRTLLLACLLFIIPAVCFSQPIEQKAIITGTAVYVVTEGSPVKEGDTLITVKTIVGPLPAARATASGIVMKVMVRPGDSVVSQTAVAIINP